MNNEDQTYNHIAKYHKIETGRGGITENYEALKKKIYFKNLKTLVSKLLITATYAINPSPIGGH